MTTLSATPVAARFAAPALLQLGAPPTQATIAQATLEAGAKTDLAARFAAVNIPYDVAGLETDPAIVVTEAAVFRDMLRRAQIDQAVAQTYLGSATGVYLDTRAQDYGCVRKTFADPTPTDTIDPGRPATVPWTWIWAPAGSALATRYLSGAAGWVQDDASLRQLAFLAWDALSVAGPPGAYAYNAANADPSVYDVVVYGPETGYVAAGQVLIMVQAYVGTFADLTTADATDPGRPANVPSSWLFAAAGSALANYYLSGNAGWVQADGGVPSLDVLQAVGAALDAWQITDGSGAVTHYPVRNPSSVRPLGAQVFVAAPTPVAYAVNATIYITPGNDPTATLVAAEARLTAYQVARQRIGMSVPISGLMAALSITDSTGLPTVDEVVIASPSADVAPAYDQLAVAGLPTIAVVVR